MATNSQTLCDRALEAVRAGDITRALVAANLSGLRLVYKENGHEYEVELPESCLILGLQSDPRQRPACQEFDLGR